MFYLLKPNTLKDDYEHSFLFPAQMILTLFWTLSRF